MLERLANTQNAHAAISLVIVLVCHQVVGSSDELLRSGQKHSLRLRTTRAEKLAPLDKAESCASCEERTNPKKHSHKLVD